MPLVGTGSAIFLSPAAAFGWRAPRGPDESRAGAETTGYEWCMTEPS